MAVEKIGQGGKGSAQESRQVLWQQLREKVPPKSPNMCQEGSPGRHQREEASKEGAKPLSNGRPLRRSICEST